MIQEEEIRKGLRRGDEKIYEMLFRELYVSLCSCARRYVYRKDIAEEIVSEVFYNVWLKRKKIHIKTSVKSYFYQSVCNSSLNYQRKQKAEQKLTSCLTDENEENYSIANSIYDDENYAETVQELEIKVRNAVELLPDQQRKIFKMKRISKMKNKEIAEELKLSVKTVEKHTTSALKFLRDEMKDYLLTVFCCLFI
ncbi:MAG: RNA polymerase sigma-70 factor [Marinifilum sp.]|jgi:RNA polymerase sigma-70 factor (ECF subfamily)|nr:RNA polymerase sigma-70 factor [Marinifilum sp.]